MKKAAIILCGLPRSFKRTSRYLFDSVITPNMSEYEIDIFINTDFVGNGLTWGRPDTCATGKSIYNYCDRDIFINDLNKEYNRYGQLKDIQIYNFNKSTPCIPWVLIIKRVEQVLIGLNLQDKKYDYYMVIRMDLVFTNVLKFSDLNNRLVLLTGNFTRPGFIHDRDWFDCFAGDHNAFMTYVYGFRLFFKDIISVDTNYIDFYDMGNICESDILICDEEIDISSLSLSIRMNDSVSHLTDRYIGTGSIDFFEKYSISHDAFKVKCYKIFNSILKYNRIILSEHLPCPLHYIIVR